MKFLTHKYNILSFILFISVNTGVKAQDGTITISQDPLIDKLVSLKKEVNANSSKEFFKIQIYNGNLAGAKTSASKFKLYFPGWECDVFFETPNYKVRVGRFRTRLEADKRLVEVKTKYPSAFILTP
ncbi:SPOR domain-containing protein [Ascidiimonas sp. W6]|uniref:SPOR domain-containing protein n=1 Tax=Ascidiimonas meishanensis TaxID=3128903 RepID=UPI0030EB47D0